MIREVKFWKEDIAADRDRLGRIAKQRGHGRKTMVNIEKCVFVTFYAIRKLLECGHLPADASGWCISVRLYQPKEDVTRDKDTAIHLLYDFDHGTVEKFHLKKLCDKFIHSQTFVMHMSPKAEIVGFFVGSYPKSGRAHDECIYIDLKTMLDTITKVVES